MLEIFWFTFGFIAGMTAALIIQEYFDGYLKWRQ